jgi:N6-adenosine-specific RNA methylase IME4
VYHNLQDIPRDKYSLLLTDPPWKQGRGGKKASRPNTTGCALDYPTQSLHDIENYFVTAVDKLTDNAVIFLWAPEKFIRSAWHMVERTGLRIHDTIIWSKCGMGTAPAFSLRFSHEYLLYCYKGKFIPVASDSRGVFPDVIHAKPRRHSQKPEESFVLIQSLYPNLVKLEMYARETRVGWDSFGNEV